MSKQALDGPDLSDAEYASRLAEVRDRLLGAQLRLRHSPECAHVLILTGAPTAGRSETANRLLEWLDPKFVDVRAFAAPQKFEKKHPVLWRYWQSLPARGRLSIVFNGWYQELFEAFLRNGNLPHKRRCVERVQALERFLVMNGIRVTKVHLHIARKTLRDRLKKLASNKLTRWRVSDEDRWHAHHYRKVSKAYEACVEATQSKEAPWHVVDGSSEDHRMYVVGGLLLGAFEAGFVRKATRAASKNNSGSGAHPFPTRPEKTVDEKAYREELEHLQGRLVLATRKKSFRKHALVLAFEGMDAAGKGGAIKRITPVLDARHYEVVPVSAPTPEELRYPYLWRFWKHVPPLGRIAIFDRTWYGRVLVERVRGFAAPDEWRRAYGEINEFERELAEHGDVVLKFWLSISLEEQLARFKERDSDPLKRFKVDPEDWKNRRFYPQYQRAAHDMVAKTNTDYAPWTIVAADDKHYARLQVLRKICEEAEKRIG